MESAPKPSRIIRIDQRYRHAAQDVSRRRDSVHEPHHDVGRREQEEESLLVERADEPLLIREQKGRRAMGRAHHLFHRRQPEPVVNILTVAVEVIATVDSLGNVIGQETVTVAVPSVPAVPSIQAVPTPVLPVVPSVPAFPSDLTVPAYPWPSGVPSVTVADVGSSVVISSPLATTDTNSPAPTLFPSSQGFNSTITNTISSSSFFSTTNSTSSRSSSSSSSSSSSRSSSSSTRSSSTSSSTSSSSTEAATTSLFGGGGGGGEPTNTEPAPSATSPAASTGNSGSGTLGTPQVVGSVIGSLAGAAILLALLLFLLKRHKQKQRGGAMQLSENDGADNAPMASSGQQQQMTTRSSFVPAGAAAFLNRFSGTSKSTAESSLTGGERGFQRISGRKLPSAFSEGMTSEQFSRGEGTLSGSSFYQDDRGFYGGPGSAAGKEFGKETGDSPSTYGAMGTKERMMPSPARTPVVHHPDDTPPWGVPRNGGSALSPPHSPNPEGPLRPSLGRSQISHDGSRSSKFTENV